MTKIVAGTEVLPLETAFERVRLNINWGHELALNSAGQMIVNIFDSLKYLTDQALEQGKLPEGMTLCGTTGIPQIHAKRLEKLIEALNSKRKAQEFRDELKDLIRFARKARKEAKRAKSR